MVVVTSEITIERPIEEVFAFVSNFENDLKWSPEVFEIRRSSDSEPGLGATYETVVGIKLMKQRGTYDIIEFAPPTTMRWAMVQGGAAGNGFYELASVPAGTSLRYGVSFRMPGIQRIFEPLISFYSNRTRAPRQLRNLKNLLESEQ